MIALVEYTKDYDALHDSRPPNPGALETRRFTDVAAVSIIDGGDLLVTYDDGDGSIGYIFRRAAWVSYEVLKP